MPPLLRKLTLRITKLVFISLLLFVVLLAYFQERLIFPATKVARSKALESDGDFRDVYFRSQDDVELHGRFYECDQPRGVIIYFHGNGDMVDWLDFFAQQLRESYQHSVFLFDYRGYGRSAGRPTGDGVLKDGRAAVQHVMELTKLPSSDMIYMGRSIGGGIAVHVAADMPPKALVLQNTFTSLSDVAANSFPWLPVRRFLRVHINPGDKIGSVRCPLLQSHGTADGLIPYEMGQALFQKANEPKQFIEIPGGGHNDQEPREYYRALQQFLEDLKESDIDPVESDASVAQD